MNLLESFNAMHPAQKRTVMVVGGLAVLIVGSYFFISVMDRKESERPRAAKPEVTVVQPARMSGVEQFGAQMEAVQKQLHELKNLTRELKEENEDLRRKQKDGNELTKDDVAAALAASPADMAPEEIDSPIVKEPPAPVMEVPPALPPPTPTPPVSTTPASPLAPVAHAAETRPAKALQIKVIGESGEIKDVEHALLREEDDLQEGKDKVYIPSGSMFTGVLLNGLDAPTSAAAQKNPTPVVMRIKREAVLPNYAAIDVRECFLVAAGYGQLSSERAMLRAENLSCVRSDGTVFETKMDAYIVGSDGKVGVPGRLVSKQGQMIARSLIAGVFGGMGSALNRTRVPTLNINPSMGTDIYQQDSLSSIFQGGAASGIGTSANMIAKFYLDMAKETFPVVEVPAGEVGTVVVTRGASLPLKGSTNLQRYTDGDEKPRAGAVNSPVNKQPTADQAKKPQTGLDSIPDNIPPEQTLDAMNRATRDVQQMFGTMNNPSLTGGSPASFGNGGW